MIANVATSVIADNFSLFGIENTSSGLTIGDSSVLSIVLNIISTAIVPAFAEEFAFRGIVMGSLRKFSDTTAVIGSAILFGAMHQNISQIPFAFILGLILRMSIANSIPFFRQLQSIFLITYMLFP